MTEAEAQKLVTVLVTAYPTQIGRQTEEQQRQLHAIYRRMLQDLDYPVANAAVERLLATSRFMPTVAEIREIAFDLIAGEVKSGGEGWGDVLKAISKYGRYQKPVFDDPVVARCVNAFGWLNICDSENAHADRARFIDMYEQVSATERRRELADALPAMRRLRSLQAAQHAEAVALPPATATTEVESEKDDNL